MSRGPKHYLDCFHGALLPGPEGGWLLDDGWVWSPFGVPKVIGAKAWLLGDVHAAEHGRSLSQRACAWDQPAAWIDSSTLAIQ